MTGFMGWLRVIAFLTCCVFNVFGLTKYYGKLIGEFRTQAHGVKGTVYAANENTFFIEGFEYDGQGPDAFFWGDTKESPTPEGFIIPNEKGTKEVLGKYTGQDLIIMLPEGKAIRDIKSLSVWCRKFTANFGLIVINNEELPKEKSLGPLPTLAHGVKSDDVIIKDVKTIHIPNLYYDGAGPDAFFLVGTGIKPHAKGTKIPDENNSLQKLSGYQGKDIKLHLPGDLTVFDIEWIALYCIAFEENFGHVMVPEKPNVPANIKDLKMMIAASTTQSRSSNSAALEQLTKGQYYGKLLGDLKTNAHDVKGTVYAASENTLYIADFSYDGLGPNAYFWAGTSEQPSPQGFIVPNEYGTKEVLKKYTDQSIAITLPDNKKISEIKWISVWCRTFEVNFGYIMISSDLELPAEKDLGTLPTLAHGVRSGKVVIKDAKTISISQLHYDGSAPDAFFFVGTGREPHPGGTKVPDENGSLNKLKGYDGKDVTLRLPGDLTVFDIEWFSLYCISYTQNFGHVMIPNNINVPADLQTLKIVEMKFENCEELFPGVFHMGWKVIGHDLYVQLTGLAEDNQYLSFGRSGQDDRSAMVGADVIVAYYNKDKRKAEVVDYFLTGKSQCSDGSGACPDVKLSGSQNAELLSWEKANGMLKVTYKRPLTASDGQDLSIPMSVPVSVVAAIGPLNSLQEVAFHTHYYNKEVIKIHFGRNPAQNRCNPLGSHGTHLMGKVDGWPPLHISDATVLRAQIGPTGKEKGYTAITGHQSWGLAWWINGMLIPEITVQRGRNYTFIVEGGDDTTNTASYHPLYITNNPEGGGGQFIEQIGSDDHRIYAGVIMDSNQNLKPIAGRLCQWTHKSVDMADESETFEGYKSTLNLICNEGNPGIFTWVPDEETPDLVYYQCFTHRNLGWKIHVKGSNVGGAMSHQSPSAAPLFSQAHIPIFTLLSVLLLFFVDKFE